MKDFDFGIVGLGVMGRNLLLNMADHGFSVAGLDLDAEKAASLESEADDKHTVKGTTNAKEFVQLIKKPRAIMLLVPAGKPVDAVIKSLLPYLEEGDIVVDGGNSYFEDTNRRVDELAAQNIHYFGMGISGGEKGARFGPSMMPGGDENSYERLRPIFEAIAAKVNGEPCVTYLGRGSAGNYVKMVHNGIEYAIMQLIAETYDVLKRGFEFEDDELQNMFASWNESELQSYLIEITAAILKKDDEITGKRLVGLISDTAKAKGTGKWTSQNAMEIQAPVPSIDLAVNMRDISKYKEERTQASKTYAWHGDSENISKESLMANFKDAFYFGMLSIYAQGMAQLTIASKEFDYGLNLEEVTKIWRGGCIIRAAVLEDFRKAYKANPKLPNLLLDENLASKLNVHQKAMRSVVKIGIDKGIPMAVYGTALTYFDAYRSETLPTNLIQAQRDYFGAHKYERIDKEGIFHTEWEE
ncbi:NADP-dependent phosphogluconate dehydrogenase [Galbibacter pacificus]|uniref:6-phosphogluconate dehydrogenase, decarboxylating n=1 Tax=Galbibacter pacificus TaxID=2996052 RepID=A0ABT6FUT7_9FLAO|nr:NADP-dependent phosphogluconate dehydrogenase [Galbibacter pacificus]MDG3583502.1 NADP-dependent phosphogluconate dehydrogenase [Galbibacter pacificus]MDG3587021.1 NADP-dependent phosphogluconate dehydrogenase [Galbibacter pacificus]